MIMRQLFLFFGMSVKTKCAICGSDFYTDAQRF